MRRRTAVEDEKWHDDNDDNNNVGCYMVVGVVVVGVVWFVPF